MLRPLALTALVAAAVPQVAGAAATCSDRSTGRNDTSFDGGGAFPILDRQNPLP